MSDPRRQLPSIDRLTRDLGARLPDVAEWAIREASRQAVASARAKVEAGDLPGDIAARAALIAQQLARPRPTRVVNATGVVLHTNLGRAALAPGAATAAAEAAAHYSDLELDLETGARGQRLSGIDTLLRVLSGAPAGMAVNNNAGAVLLALGTLARGKEVVVSRGELVEIGGSFRVPDIMEQAGVKLREVGTTNRTHARDYEAVIGPETGVLLKVHRSNFEQRGFVADVALPELAAIGQKHGVPVVEDLGSGTLVDLRPYGLPDDTYAPARLRDGVDLVCFSGDKLLGGPQAGLLLGTEARIAELRANPMARALRMGKLSLAALDFTLRAMAEGRSDEIPTLRMLREAPERVEARARALETRLTKVVPTGASLGLAETTAPVGGGSVPGFELPSFAVTFELSGRSAADLAASLRGAPVPVLARVEDARVLIDARTLLPGDDVAIEAAIAAIDVSIAASSDDMSAAPD